jgi:hypothetical protein
MNSCGAVQSWVCVDNRDLSRWNVFCGRAKPSIGRFGSKNRKCSYPLRIRLFWRIPCRLMLYGAEVGADHP